MDLFGCWYYLFGVCLGVVNLLIIWLGGCKMFLDFLIVLVFIFLIFFFFCVVGIKDLGIMFRLLLVFLVCLIVFWVVVVELVVVVLVCGFF